MIKRLLKWRDDRHTLARLKYELEDDDAKFQRAVKEHRLRRGSDEYEKLYWDHDNNRQLTEAEIDAIETKKAIDRAIAWDVPIPPVPRSEDEDDQYWHWCRVHGRYYLTDEGRALLRREAYAEMEMRFKPWLTWLAIGMSATSLIISVVKF